MAFVFGLQTLRLIDLSIIYHLKGLKPKNKGHTNFYECCNLTEKSISTVRSAAAAIYCSRCEAHSKPRPISNFFDVICEGLCSQSI